MWVLCGSPFSWGKCRGGLQVDWIGYWLDYATFSIGISEARCHWLIRWAESILQCGTLLVRGLAEGLGRLGFATGILEWGRPFLAPLYSLVSVASKSALVSLPMLPRLCLMWIVEQLKEGRRTADCRHSPKDLGEIFRTDSKATDSEVTLGGWECARGTLPGQARWFSLTISPAQAPWLFAKGHASRTIASSEMLGSLVGIVLFAPSGRLTSGLTRCRGITDNLGNDFIVRRMLTTKLPGAIVLMQLATLLGERGLWLDLCWRSREENKEADALTNQDFSSFDMNNRVSIEYKDLPLDMMNRFLDCMEGHNKVRELLRLDRAAGAVVQASLPAHSFTRKKRKVKTPW